MSKLILTLFLALYFLQTPGQTSVYHPFPDSNAVWNFSASNVCMSPIGSYGAAFSITITGDTIINNNTYHKLYTPTIFAVIFGNCFPNFPVYYIGCIRENVTQKMVYIIPPNDSVEQLLYDFNLQVGDTVKGYLETFTFFPDVVQFIDSVLVGNSYRKRWLLNPYYYIYIIEGIGSTYGLINFSPGSITEADIIDLTCFKQYNQTLYPDTTTVCDLITVSVPGIENEVQEFKIFPNPASEEINISLKLEKPTDVEMQLYNSLGQKIKEVLEEKLTAGQNKIDFSVEDIPEGVYYLKIYTNENEFTRKIIKY